MIGAGAVSAVGIGLALKKLKDTAPAAGRAPLVGLAAAFVFAAQMVNFPVATAVSGHLLGATLLGVLFGPWMTLLIMSSVLILQALLFQDGGVTALGANILNLAIVANFSAWFLFKLLAPKQGEKAGFGRREAVAVFVAAWGSTLLAAGAVAMELVPSGVAPLARLMLLLGGSHALIGLGEGFITVLVLKALYKAGYGERLGCNHPSLHGNTAN